MGKFYIMHYSEGHTCPLKIHCKGGLTFGRGLTFQIIQYLDSMCTFQHIFLSYDAITDTALHHLAMLSLQPELIWALHPDSLSWYSIEHTERDPTIQWDQWGLTGKVEWVEVRTVGGGGPLPSTYANPLSLDGIGHHPGHCTHPCGYTSPLSGAPGSNMQPCSISYSSWASCQQRWCHFGSTFFSLHVHNLLKWKPFTALWDAIRDY